MTERWHDAIPLSRAARRRRARLSLTAVMLSLLAAFPAQGGARQASDGLITAAAGCAYDGRLYAEGTVSEGSGPGHLCLPAGACFTASVVLPKYRCQAGQWRCVQFCPR